MTTIFCRVELVAQSEAFIATKPVKSIIALRAPGAGPWPLGLNLDGQILFDMHADGRVASVEIMARSAGALLSDRVVRKVADNRFHALFLTPPAGGLSAEEAGLKQVRRGMDGVEWSLGTPRAPTRCWLGGGSFVDIEDSTLVGVGIAFQA